MRVARVRPTDHVAARPAVRAVVLVTIALAALAALTARPVTALAPASEPPPDPAPVELTLFWGDGCPHCAAEKEFLEELQVEHPDLVIRQYEVWNSPANQALLVEMAAAAGVDARAVPTTFLGDLVWIGYDRSVGEQIAAAVETALAGGTPVQPESRTVDVPLVGEVDLGGRSLLVSTVIIGFVDGVNPCSLWVLSILLALVLHSGSRGRVAAVGAVFLLVTSAMYGLYIAGAYSALSYARFLPWIQRAVALVAGGMGLLQLKDAFGVAGGPSLGVPEAARPGMYQRMRRLSVSDRSIPALLGATGALAVGVSLLETPCTLGLPILWTNLLADSDVAFAGAAVLFVVYLTAFLIDELVVFTAVVATMRAVKVQEHHGRALKLVSGVVMLTLAVAMIVRPSTMESVGGALLVFAVAAAAAALGLVLQRTIQRTKRHVRPTTGGPAIRPH